MTRHEAFGVETGHVTGQLLVRHSFSSKN